MAAAATPPRRFNSPGFIFLDVDGVLASARCNTYCFEPGDPTLVHDPTRENVPLERRCLEQLARMAAEGEAAVVVSSTWRLHDDMRAFLFDCLREYGVEILGGGSGTGGADAIWGTPDLGSAGRGAEVFQWLQRWRQAQQQQGLPSSPVRYVVLDDNHVESFLANGLIERFVRTQYRCPDEWEEGLTAQAADAALAILATEDAAGGDGGGGDDDDALGAVNQTD